MVTICIRREICIPSSVAWNIISDLDNEPKYWREMKSVKRLRTINQNVIEREVIISYINSRFREIVTLAPKDLIEVKIIAGPLHGTKTIALNNIGNKTCIDVCWNIKLTGFLGVFAPIAKIYIAQQTADALKRRAKTTEHQHS